MSRLAVIWNQNSSFSLGSSKRLNWVAKISQKEHQDESEAVTKSKHAFKGKLN